MPNKKSSHSSSNKPQHSKKTLVSSNTVLKLNIPWNQVKDSYQAVLKQEAKKVKLSGFRQGKVPLKLAEENLGRTQLVDLTLNKIVPDFYLKLIKKEKKLPLTAPEIKPSSLKWGEEWLLEVQIAEKPEIKLGNYRKLIKQGKSEAKKDLKKNKQAKKGKGDPKDKGQQNNEQSTILQHIYRALVAAIAPAIPELLLKDQTKKDLEKLVTDLKGIKLSLDDYLKKSGISFENLSSDLAVTALSRLQLEFILSEISLDNKLGATKAAIKREVAKVKDKKLKKEFLANPRYQAYLSSQITRQKVIDFLLKF